MGRLLRLALLQLVGFAMTCPLLWLRVHLYLLRDKLLATCVGIQYSELRCCSPRERGRNVAWSWVSRPCGPPEMRSVVWSDV